MHVVVAREHPVTQIILIYATAIEQRNIPSEQEQQKKGRTMPCFPACLCSQCSPSHTSVPTGTLTASS